MREALPGLTTRGRCFLAAGTRRAPVASLLLGQQDLLRVAVLLVALPLVSCRGRGPHPLPAGLHSARLAPAASPAGERGPGRAAAGERLPAAHRAAARSRTGCPYVLGSAAAVRARPGRAARRREVAYPVRSEVARPLHARPADAPADRPVRDVRAGPVVHRHRRPRRHARSSRRCRRSPLGGEWAGSGDEPAAVASPPPARTTSPPASTATATTCAGCTGAPPPAAAS